jgi:hypothetical protein
LALENKVDPIDQPAIASAFSKLDKVASPKTTADKKLKESLTIKKKHRTDDEHNTNIEDSDSDNSKMPMKFKKKKRRRANFTMIVKPDCLSQGKGIFLTHDLDQIPIGEPHVV